MHRLGVVVTLSHRVLFLLELCPLALDSGNFVGGEQGDVFQALLEQVTSLFLLAGDFVNLLAHLGIDFDAHHLFEQQTFLVVVGIEELGKLALGEDDSAEELADIQPDELGDEGVNFGLLGQIDGRGDAILGAQGACHILQGAVCPVAGAVDVPRGDVGGALVVVKGQTHVGAAAATSQQLARIVGVKALVGTLALVVGPSCRLHARCGAVQCQAQAVDNGGFARACVARYQEEPFLAQRRCVKVNLSFLNRSDVADM